MVFLVDLFPMKMTPQSSPGVTRQTLYKVTSTSRLELELSQSLEILEESKFNLLDIFNSVGLDYWYTDDGQREFNSIIFNLTSLEDNNMILDTRSTYPSDKVTLTLADVPRDKSIVFLNIYLDLNDEFDVALVLEDSRRNKLCECQKYLNLKL